jgi:hypothetical protein
VFEGRCLRAGSLVQRLGLRGNVGCAGDAGGLGMAFWAQPVLICVPLRSVGRSLQKPYRIPRKFLARGGGEGMPRYAEATGGVGEGGNKVELTAETGCWEIPDTLTGR